MIILIALVLLIYFKPKTWDIEFLINMPIIMYLFYIVPGRTFGTNIIFFHYIDYFAFSIVFIGFLKRTRMIKSPSFVSSIRLIIVFILLQIIAISFSSDKSLTTIRVVMVSIYLISFIIYFKLFTCFKNSKELFARFISNIIITLVLFDVTAVIMSLLGIENTAGYGNSIVSFGRMGFFGLYPFTYFSIVIFFIIRKKNSKSVLYSFLWITTLLLFTFLAKRTFIVIIILGAIFIIIGMFKNIKKILIPLIIISIILFQAKTYIDKYFIERRGNVLERKYDDSRRYLEYVYYFTYKIKELPIENILFGTEYFNSFKADFFSEGNSPFHDKNRVLHSDYSGFLYGTGIVGLTVYLLFLVSLIKNIFPIKSKKLSTENKLYKVVFISLWIVLIINGFADGYGGFFNRLIPFSLLGAFSGRLLFSAKIEKREVIV